MQRTDERLRVLMLYGVESRAVWMSSCHCRTCHCLSMPGPDSWPWEAHLFPYHRVINHHENGNPSKLIHPSRNHGYRTSRQFCPTLITRPWSQPR